MALPTPCEGGGRPYLAASVGRQAGPAAAGAGVDVIVSPIPEDTVQSSNDDVVQLRQGIYLPGWLSINKLPSKGRKSYVGCKLNATYIFFSFGQQQAQSKLRRGYIVTGC